jgi:hypothetical protein
MLKLNSVIALAVATFSLAATAHPHHGGHHHPPRYGYGTDQKICATLHDSHSPYSRTLNISASTNISDLGNFSLDGYDTWNNDVASVDVAPGCQAVAYQYKNYNIDLYSGRPMHGFVVNMVNTSGYYSQTFHMNRYADDRVSSLTCTCY